MQYGPVSLQNYFDEFEVWVPQEDGSRLYREFADSQYLLVTNPNLVVPSNKTISKVVFSIDRKADYNDSYSYTKDLEIALIVNGVIQPENKSLGAQWSTSLHTATFEFTNSLQPSDINTNFGLAIKAYNHDEQGIVLGGHIYDVRVSVETD
jgi:hypothetical protein